ncbi:centromere protein Scm3-domain-containing protein [Macrophomina phaseolina]|uniref:Centromere protein Scm3-domain-containing protein n=1 Tax=Macrophomina phaseolina TaxID=35725 RepID=A0ABQ8GMH7_9PEZI|nr:centromere protein Scm3-domain-containing protein [Macrophomina phaseolina]
MERRPSLLPPTDAEHYDDLSELERERHENDMRLKNTFEHIFEKYSRDFSGIGDEIDLETGEIVVDNGHIAQLQDERDTGKAFDDWVDDVDGDEQDYEEHTYTRYELEDSEDELLSSPSRDVHRRVSQPGGVFASLSSLTWQASPIAPSSSASASQHRNRPPNNRPARHPPKLHVLHRELA